MDGSGFDRFARALAAPANRRAAVAAVGLGLAGLAPAATTARCGRRKVRCEGRCVRKKGLPCCGDGDCSVANRCFRTKCGPPASGGFRNVKLTVENRTGNSLTLEFWHKANLSCTRDSSQTLANNASADFNSSAMNAVAWINGQYLLEGDNPWAGTPFVNLFHGGTFSEGLSCYSPGTSDLVLHSLVEGEGVNRTVDSFNFELSRLDDTDDYKVFRFTVRHS
jgi:hypothetical protein